MAEVASAFVTLIPSFRGGSAAISKEFDGPAGRAGKDSGRRFGGGMAAGLGGVATKVFAPLAAAAGAAGIASFFSDAVGAASDLNEAATKTEAIFGKAGAAAVQAFAGQGAKALGQTKLEVVNAAATFGTFGKAAGKSGVDLAKFSTGFASLSTDLASFYNTSPEEAVEAIGAALRGEAEPIRKYGVLLDDATLRQEALRLGLIKTTKQALTPQQKVLAAQAAIYKQTKDAQGDFGRTSGGLANQQRILSAQFSDFKATVGQALLPVITRFVTFLNANLIPGIKRVGEFIQPAVAAFSVFKEAIFGGEVTTVGPLGKVGDIAYGIRDAFVAMAPTVRQFVSTVVTAISGAVESFKKYYAVVIPIVQQFVSQVMARIGPMLPQIKAVFSQIGSAISEAMALVSAVIGRVTQFVSYVWTNWGAQIVGLVTNAFGTVIGVLGGAFKIISGLFKIVTSLIKGDWSGVWEGIKRVVSGALGIVKSVIKGAFGQIAALFGTTMSDLNARAAKGWQRIKDGASSGVSAFVSFVKGLPGRAVAAIGDLGQLLYQKGQALIQGLIDGIKSKIKAIGDAVGSVAQKVKDFFPGSPVKTGPLTSWNNGGAGKRLGDMLAGGLLDSRSPVGAASARLAASVASPSATLAATGAGGSGRIDLSDVSLHRLAAILRDSPVQANLSVSQVDSALGVLA